jgi:hypothetical protein
LTYDGVFVFFTHVARNSEHDALHIQVVRDVTLCRPRNDSPGPNHWQHRRENNISCNTRMSVFWYADIGDTSLSG